MRDLEAFNSAVVAALSNAAAEAARADGPEAALSIITRTARENWGDPDAARQPGNLKEGEIEQSAAVSFFLLPSGDRHVLLAPQNYGTDSSDYLVIGTDVGHPGWMVKNQKPLILRNTDDHKSSFVQILKTFRAGSVVYAPIIWQGRFMGQIICAAQARNTMDEPDLAAHVALANLAAAVWVAHGGPAFIEDLAKRLDA